MAKTKPAAPKPLTGLQLAEMLKLLKGADSIELKLTVPTGEQRSAIAGLGMDPLDAQVRQIVFFDTPDLALNNAGLVVRARRVQGKGDDSVIKLRPVVPDELPSSLRKIAGLRRRGGRDARRVRLLGVVQGDAGDRRRVRKVLLRRAPHPQAVHDRSSVPSTPRMPPRASGSTTCPLGPITAMKLKFQPKEFPRPIVAELWLYPDGSRILELSTKAPPAEGFQVAAEARAYLASKGVDISGEQQTKTRTALEYYTAIRDVKHK